MRFVVLTRLGSTRLPHCPTQAVRYVAKCYGQGGNPAQDADALAGAVGNAAHDKGHRISGAGVAIFGSYAPDTGGATKDPDTDQPMTPVFIDVGASTALLT